MDTLVPLWVTSVATGCGVIYAIIRNGSRGKKQDEQLKLELKGEVASIKEKLEDPDTGLYAIKKVVDEQKLNCAQISTRLEENVKTNSIEIFNLRKKRPK